MLTGFYLFQTANHKGQADKVIEFVKSDSALAEKVNADYVIMKETEKLKYLPKQVVDFIKNAGYPKFSMHEHTLLWQSKDAKNKSKGYGAMVAGEKWHWYQRWVDEVLKHCENSGGKYK